jgi:hypothetical protein
LRDKVDGNVYMNDDDADACSLDIVLHIIHAVVTILLLP